MSNVKITFKLTEMPCYGVSFSGGRKTLDFQAFDGTADIAVGYDYDRRPLCLTASVSVDDVVDVILMPHRIELYVNGKLEDEEWPAGNRLYSLGDGIISSVSVNASEYAEPVTEHPCVLSTFTCAEGWKPEEKVFVGDCMPFVKDGEYHVLYLKDRHRHGSKWGLGAHQWEHISTKDFSEWRVHPMAVPITDPAEGSICTGSWIRKDGTEYLYYTVRRGNGLPNPIRRSISHDGYHFVKDEGFGFTLSDKYVVSRVRDPKIIKGDDGRYHMFLTTALAKENRGCLVHFISENMEEWTELEDPIYISDSDAHPECPDYIYYKGHYYLIFSIHGRARYLISDYPFDGWRVPSDPLIPCARVPKGAVWGEKIVFVGYESPRPYAGVMTFRTATADENGELIFE